MRARRKLRKAFKDKKAEYDRCKGEHWCTTKGLLKRKNEGRPRWLYTLDNFCKSGSCQYYETKPEAIPVGLESAVATAEDLRSRHARGLMPATSDLSAYEVKCYMTACDAQDIVDGEDDDGAAAGDDRPPVLPPKGEHSAFAHWFDED